MSEPYTLYGASVKIALHLMGALANWTSCFHSLIAS